MSRIQWHELDQEAARQISVELFQEQPKNGMGAGLEECNKCSHFGPQSWRGPRSQLDDRAADKYYLKYYFLNVLVSASTL